MARERVLKNLYAIFAEDVPQGDGVIEISKIGRRPQPMRRYIICAHNFA
jgi:hypothetical protein